MERDGHRRITGYTPESEWDQTERDWMLALDDYEHSLCPRCGMPVSVCHDELTPTRYTAEAGVCQISLMRDIAAEDWRKQHDGEAGIKTMSLTTAIKEDKETTMAGGLNRNITVRLLADTSKFTAGMAKVSAEAEKTSTTMERRAARRSS